MSMNNSHPLHGGIAAMNGKTELERRLEETRGGLEIELGKLSAKPGDVVVVKIPSTTHPELINSIAKTVISALPDGVTFVGLFEGMELEHVTAEDMAKLGWVRAEAASA